MHGEVDDNTGTFPIQSERLYVALKGHGATVRYVTLPNEAHGYAARETLLHVLAERLNWFDKYVKNAGAEARRRRASALIAGIEMPTAIDISSVVGLIAVGMFTAQILMGLLLSVGYNPIRQLAAPALDQAVHLSQLARLHRPGHGGASIRDSALLVRGRISTVRHRRADLVADPADPDHARSDRVLPGRVRGADVVLPADASAAIAGSSCTSPRTPRRLCSTSTASGRILC